MTFVYPLLLGGLLLAGLPVLLHFLARKKPKTVVFPAFRFLVEKQRSNRRNMRLRHLLLLLVRMLLIVLVCLALSRPRLFHESVRGLSREKPVALALIFDTTPSMEYKVGDMTRLDLAKRRALELLDQLPEDCRVLVLDCANPSAFGREEFLRSLEQARRRIQSLTIRPESVPVTRALEEAHRRFATWEDADAHRLSRYVCVFSDGTRPSWTSNFQLHRSADGPPVQNLYFDVGVDDPIDLGIVQAEFADQRQAYVEGEQIPLRVTVTATTKTSNAIVVHVGGRKSAPQSFHAEPGKDQSLALELNTSGWKPGLHELSVRLETLEDAMPHNNERYLTLQIRAMPRVLVLADDLKASAEFAHALRVLRHAVDHQHIDAKVNLAEYDAIFMVGVAAPDKRWQELAKYVADGRSVCVIPPGAGLQRSAYTSDAAKAVLPGVLQGRIDADAREWDLLDVAERGHPLLAPFRKWLADGVDYDFIDSPRSATSYWRFDAPQAHVAVTYAGTARHPAVLERPAQKGSGRVLLLTTPMDANAGAWNNYAEKRTTFYLALTLMCARRLVEAPADRNFNYTLGRQPLVITHAGEKHPKYLLRSGESSEEIRLDERGVWTGEQVQKAGNYAVVGIDPAEGGETVLHRFSLNIAGEESDLARVGFAALEAALGKGAIVAQDRHTSIVDSLSTHWDEPIELFPWLLIALLILLFLETWLANRFYRTPADAPAHKP